MIEEVFHFVCRADLGATLRSDKHLLPVAGTTCKDSSIMRIEERPETPD